MPAVVSVSPFTDTILAILFYFTIVRPIGDPRLVPLYLLVSIGMLGYYSTEVSINTVDTS